MESQLTIMFEHQKVLDDRIIKKHQLEDKDLIENKLVALLVEIGELANATRCTGALNLQLLKKKFLKNSWMEFTFLSVWQMTLALLQGSLWSRMIILRTN